MCSQFRLQPFSADSGGILIAGAVRNERFVGNIQSEFTIFACAAHVECVFTRERLRLEPEVLNDDTGAHFAPPGTNTGPESVGAGLTALARLARRRFGGMPSAASMTMRLVTNFLIPWVSKSMV